MTLMHQGAQELETTRLLLRPVTPADAPDLFDGCLADPLVTRFITIPTHHEVAETEALLLKAIDGYQDPCFYYWAMVPKATGRIAGIMLVINNDERSHKCEVGYYLSRAHWGQGLVSEALMAVIELLFMRVGYHRLEARCDAANSASAKVLAKCGFIHEGRLRKSFRNHEGQYVDTDFYGLLQEEWRRG